MARKFVNALFFFLIIFSGCSIKEGVKNVSDEEMLMERGTMYWGYLCKEQFDKAYEFEYPVYRKTVGLMDYIRRFRPNVKWKSATIEKVDVEKEVASMKVSIDTEIRMTVPKTPKKVEINPRLELNEKWVKVEGIWYHVPRQFIEKEARKEV